MIQRRGKEVRLKEPRRRKDLLIVYVFSERR